LAVVVALQLVSVALALRMAWLMMMPMEVAMVPVPLAPTATVAMLLPVLLAVSQLRRPMRLLLPRLRLMQLWQKLTSSILVNSLPVPVRLMMQ